MKYPQSIQNLINEFTKFPTVGPKTAERFVFYLLKQNKENLEKLAQTIEKLKNNIKICQQCFAISENELCEICQNKERDQSIICIVSSTRDMLSIEATGKYKGYYHILGGVINIIQDIKPEQLTINKLLSRLQENKIKEIILALNPDIDGETTCMYLNKILKPYNLKITRLAKGLPMGADLEYTDELTLANALKYRNEI